MKFETASITHPGLVRKHNEDHIELAEEDGIVALADGMGGHQAGEVASEIAAGVAVEALRESAGNKIYDTLQCLIRIGQAVETANSSVYSLSKKQNQLTGMGTTLVLVLLRGERIFFAHVGDSRLYRVREGKLRQLTKDHSLLQEVLDHGIFSTAEEASEAGVHSHVLTRSLGYTMDVNVDVSEARVSAGDYYLVCSDGLSDLVSDYDILEIVNNEGEALEEKADRLVKAALEAGGKDNISLVLTRIKSTNGGSGT